MLASGFSNKRKVKKDSISPPSAMKKVESEFFKKSTNLRDDFIDEELLGSKISPD